MRRDGSKNHRISAYNGRGSTFREESTRGRIGLSSVPSSAAHHRRRPALVVASKRPGVYGRLEFRDLTRYSCQPPNSRELETYESHESFATLLSRSFCCNAGSASARTLHRIGGYPRGYPPIRYSVCILPQSLQLNPSCKQEAGIPLVLTAWCRGGERWWGVQDRSQNDHDKGIPETTRIWYFVEGFVVVWVWGWLRLSSFRATKRVYVRTRYVYPG